MDQMLNHHESSISSCDTKENLMLFLLNGLRSHELSMACAEHDLPLVML